MKSLTLLFLFQIGLHFLLFSQDEVISYNKKIKYTFERFSSLKTTKIEQGSTLFVECLKGDTIIRYDCNLISANKSSLKVNCYYLSKSFQSYGEDYDETHSIYKQNIITIPFSDIDYIQKEDNKMTIPAALISLGITGGVFAPLFCIDKDSPNRFNVKRYIEVLKYSALSVAAGIATIIPLAVSNRYYLKPKLITSNE